jgi:hypothetical protein
MASARELSYDDLPSKSWINEKLVFTHGNGVSLAHVARITPEGLPEFIVKDIPPTSITKDIKVSTPEIYFGELTRSYAIANTRIPEFSLPHLGRERLTAPTKGPAAWLSIPSSRDLSLPHTSRTPRYCFHRISGPTAASFTSAT